MNHGESDSRRSSTSVRLSLPAPEHNGHSMVSVGNGDRVVMYPRGRGRGLSQVGRASKFLGEMCVVLLLVPDQETGIGGIDRNQAPVSVTCRVEPLVGATEDSVAFVSLDGRRVAEASCDRADDLAVPSRM